MNVLQRQAALRLRGDGQRDAHLLGIGLCRTGIGRDILLVEVEIATDIPVVGRGGIGAIERAALRITVVNDALHAVDEVAACLHLIGSCHLIISILFVTDGTLVGGGQCHLTGGIVVQKLTMHILGIDIAATLTGGHIDKCQFYHTGDRTIDFLLLRLGLLVEYLQPHTRTQCHLVETAAVVAFTVVQVGLFPFKICLAIISAVYGLRALGGTCRTELHIAGQRTEVVHHTVDTEVVAVG